MISSRSLCVHCTWEGRLVRRDKKRAKAKAERAGVIAGAMKYNEREVACASARRGGEAKRGRSALKSKS
eukprot:3223075-Pleurochrysis_carterae.AAC.1